ncbi:uncharacterized protein TRUGW13939_02512 [Talaromyces rugulosus]|uniref:Uncharacterized protein n=1 Tax=Talaromyces rugulosus TaxID=121627 RepID=A0A7H8QNJ7_TALRU|nr:uncharacterized protein TRUGW13939_02512 [Talaromyces rugulosus]QKX55419.1 hypothetical protein TRUGW13939_02512 [Talaromyces rugulosus]
MSDQGYPDIHVDLDAGEKNVELGGISKEVWKTLEEKWGNLAKALHRLNIFLNFHDHYKHDDDAPDSVDWAMTKGAPSVNNTKIELAEIRYGRIESIAPKDSLWFIIKHHQDPQGPIHKMSTFYSSVQIYNGDKTVKHKILPDVPVRVIEATQHGLDTYVLLAMHAEPNEWGPVLNICKGRLEVKESVTVRVMDSKPQGKHRSATWKGEEKN